MGQKHTFTFTVVDPSAQTALQAFAVGKAAGSLTEFPAPSVAVLNNGSYPWDSTKAASDAGLNTGGPLLEWANMMDKDTITKQYFINGGRPYGNNEPLKMIYYDELANNWGSRDRWHPTSGCGHLYRSTTVMPQHRLVAYIPHGGNTDGTSTINFFNIDTLAVAGSIPKPPYQIGGSTSGWSGNHCLIWFPTMGPQGALIFGNFSNSRVVKWLWPSGPWTAIAHTPGKFYDRHVSGHYHPIVDKMILGSSSHVDQRQLAIVDPAGLVLTYSATCPASMTCGGSIRGVFVPHPTRAASILFCRNTNVIWSYEWASDTWVNRGAVPALLQASGMIACVHDEGILFSVLLATAQTTKTYYWKPDF